MNRFRRIRWNALSAASVLLCAASLGLWARSYSNAQYVGWASANQFDGVLSMGGLVRLEHATYGDGPMGWSYIHYPTPAGGLRDEIHARDRGGGAIRAAGFAWATIDYNGDGKRIRRALYLPHWAFSVLFLALPLLRLAKRSPRRPAGTCAVCGYDMRATPNRCPECGAAGTPASPPALPGSPKVPTWTSAFQNFPGNVRRWMFDVQSVIELNLPAGRSVR
jgi:hypothetical protein